jgi:hypothetical protein
MKSMMLRSLLVLALIAVVTGCRDKDTEKRIAELEAQIQDLKGQKTAAAQTTPLAVQPGVKTEQPGQQAEPEGPVAAVNFPTVEHDFGTIKEGQVVEYTYAFTNTSQVPLVIQDAKPSCGCTAPDWTKTPVAPGATGFVKAKFDSNNKSGLQNKTITVTANTYPKQTVLKFKAMVTPKATAADGPVK